ncbi:class F sortase [Micromonospora matsumotoense]|uniref:class F sortase n=1 Tax=Micromonospora matsumotoense TaxID=121616 RepID=UPI003D8F3CBB
MTMPPPPVPSGPRNGPTPQPPTSGPQIFHPTPPPATTPPATPVPPYRGPAGAPSPAGVAPPGAGSTRGPWSVPLAVLLVLLGVFATGAGLGRTVGPLDWTDTPPQRPAADARTSPPPGSLPASRPVRLTVPAIKVAAPVAPVGQARDGSIDVPPLDRHHETGWYDRGPTPGEPGRAIIVGHVDSKDGPSVFYDLRKLKPGDRIEVTRDDRRVVVFRVDSVEFFDKSALPADRVYGDSGAPALRLITCGGQWIGGRTGYADNVVAFASLAETRSP